MKGPVSDGILGRSLWECAGDLDYVSELPITSGLFQIFANKPKVLSWLGDDVVTISMMSHLTLSRPLGYYKHKSRDVIVFHR